MKIGSTAVLTEYVIATDEQGIDYLLPGTEGQVTDIHGDTFSFKVKSGTYENIPLSAAEEYRPLRKAA